MPPSAYECGANESATERAVIVNATLAALPPDVPVVAMRDGQRWILAAAPETVLDINGVDAFAAVDRLRDGWWAGWLTYELGHAVERVRSERPTSDRTRLPDLRLARFDARLIVEPDRMYVEGDGETRALLVEAARHAVSSDAAAGRVTEAAVAQSEWTSSMTAGAFTDHVDTIIERINAGDCYQVNLTRRLLTPVRIDPTALFAALTRHNPAPHAALLRFRDASIVSASPELFLRREGDIVMTRPIKGTAPEGAAGTIALLASSKDRAENVMIVDLSRNDLGRVCAFGTISVPELCTLEEHPGLVHLVSTVRGALRPGLGLGALLRATYPPASITGAPKPRVMQIIDDLEPEPRGVYCGAVGWIDCDNHVADFSVAIRTFTVSADETWLGVGAGIVADSDPALEWEETELKAARLLAAAGARNPRPVGARS